MSQWLKLRLSLVFFGFLFFFSFIVFRLVQLQVLPNSALSELSRRQFTRTEKKAPYRLPILDRNHEELAVSVPVVSVYAHPKQIKARKKTARALAKHLGGSANKWLSKLDKNKNFVWLLRQTSSEGAQELKKLKLSGVGVESENKRVYPNGHLASHILGYTDIDGNGLSGIELSQNSFLLQEKSKVRHAKDGRGNTSYIEKNSTEKLEEPPSVALTIDRRLQSMVEQELDRALSEHKAKSAFAIVMDPHNGEILALAQRPDFDPNFPNQASEDEHQNKLTQALYEPGSTLKVLFAAEALEKGLMTSQTILDCGNGKIKVGKTVLSEADQKHAHKSLPLSKVIAYSSNVGAVRVAEKLGTSGASELFHRFGLNQKTGVELGGEASTPAKSKSSMTPLLLATMGFGQGVSMTPLQLVTAFSPFANGGFLVRPTLVMHDKDSQEKGTPMGERVISETTAEEIKKILVQVTEDPKASGTLARIPGVLIAGKTGTAQKYDPKMGYKSGKYYSSFVGFLPADKPELLIGVMVDEPKSQYYASLVATPLFKRVAEHSLHLLNRLPAQTTAQGPRPKRPEVSPPEELTENSQGKWIMPNLSGLTLQEAMNLLNRYVEKIQVSGNGYVTSQVPTPGETLDENSYVSLKLKGFEE